MINLWRRKRDGFRALADRLSSDPGKIADERLFFERIIGGQATMCSGTLRSLEMLRNSLERIPSEQRELIGSVVAARCFAAPLTLRGRDGESPTDIVASDAAFKTCGSLAKDLKDRLENAANAAIDAADQLAAAEQEYRARLVRAIENDSSYVASRGGDARTDRLSERAEQQLAEAASFVRNLAMDLDTIDRPGATITAELVRSMKESCVSFLDDAIEGRAAAIARKYDYYPALADLGAGFVTFGGEMLGGPPGVPSFIGVILGVFARLWSALALPQRKTAIFNAVRRLRYIH